MSPQLYHNHAHGDDANEVARRELEVRLGGKIRHEVAQAILDGRLRNGEKLLQRLRLAHRRGSVQREALRLTESSFRGSGVPARLPV